MKICPEKILFITFLFLFWDIFFSSFLRYILQFICTLMPQVWWACFFLRYIFSLFLLFIYLYSLTYHVKLVFQYFEIYYLYLTASLFSETAGMSQVNWIIMMILSIHSSFFHEINGVHLWAVQVMEDIVSIILKLFRYYGSWGSFEVADGCMIYAQMYTRHVVVN